MNGVLERANDFGDTTLAFATNGTISLRRDYVVLGVDVDTPSQTAARLNALSPSFGIPMTVCTNVDHAAGIDLVTRVRLAAGAVTLTAGGGAFKVWLDRSSTGDLPLLLADSVTQRITFVRPPLRLDITRGGSIDDGDAAAWHDGRTFYYWVNEDKLSGDWINQGLNLVPNMRDFTVNGTFDLVNFFPVALDLSAFTAAWQGRVTYTVKPKWGAAKTFNYCFADVPWNRAGSIQTRGGAGG